MDRADLWRQILAAGDERDQEPRTQVTLIAVVGGLKGFPEAITAVFHKTYVQTCILHLNRCSMQFASWKERNPIAAALKPFYRAKNGEVAERELRTFDGGIWGREYPTIAPSWRRAWEHVIPFFAFPSDVRRVIDTTNAIESLHMHLRKIIKTRGHFPSDEAAIKLMWLALRNILANKVRSAKKWQTAMNQFAVMYGERFTGLTA